MIYKYKSYQEILQQFAIACHTDELDFWKQLNILVWFDEVDRTYVDRLKKTCRYLPQEYFEIFERYSSFTINRFGFYGGDILQRKRIDEASCDTWWRIGIYNDADEVCISKSGAVWIIYTDRDEEPKQISNSFTEFMDECVFGDRYLEFNGGNENDDAYRFIKFFRESNENKYAKMSEAERLRIRQNLDNQEAEIRRLMKEQEKPINKAMGFVKNMFHREQWRD